MKQATTTTTMFKAVLAFTILFAAFLAVAINYNRVYKVKNEVISITEKYEGISKTSLTIINNYLKNSGYSTKGTCRSGEYGVLDLANPKYELASPNTKYYYCLNYYCGNTTCKDGDMSCAQKKCIVKDSDSLKSNQIYYKATFFLKFNIPYLGELFIFEVDGETKAIKLYAEWQKLS